MAASEHNTDSSTLPLHSLPPQILTWESIPALQLWAGETRTITLPLQQTQVLPVQFSMSPASNWITLDAHHGQLILNPALADIGSYEFELTASSAQAVAVTRLLVEVVDKSPHIQFLSPLWLQARGGELTQFKLIASHNHHHTLTYQLISPQPWMSFEPDSATLTVQADNTQTGDYPVKVQITDGEITTQVDLHVQVLRNYRDAKLTFRFDNKEANQLVYLGINVNNGAVTIKETVSENKSALKHNRLSVGDRLELAIEKTSNHQVCTLEYDELILTDIPQSVRISCLTPVSQSFAHAERSFYLQEGAFDPDPYDLKNALGQEIRERPTVKFSVDNPQIATVEYLGKEKALKIVPHNTGTVTITAEPAGEFYDVHNNASYTVHILDKTHAIRTEFCQINCVDGYGKYQALVAGRSVTVRMYDIKGDFTFQALDDAGRVLFNSALHCDSIKGPQVSYQLDQTCNVELPSEAVVVNGRYQLIPEGSVTPVIDIAPNIFSAKELIVTLVRVKVNTKNDGQSYLGSYNLFPDRRSDDEALEDIRTLLQDKFAFTKVSVRVHPTIIEFTSDSWKYSVLDKAISRIDAMRASDLGRGFANRNVYYGLVPLQPKARTLGVGFVGSSAGIDASTGNLPPRDIAQCRGKACLYRFYGTLVHELGHTLGIGHAPCGSTAFPSLGWKYTDWKRGYKGVLNNSPIWQQSSKTLMSPYYDSDVNPGDRYPVFDIMGYCHGFQFSEYNVFTLLNNLRRYNKFEYNGPLAMVEPAVNTVSWLISDTDIELQPLHSGQNNLLPNSDYRVEVQTDKGIHQLMATQRPLFDQHQSLYQVNVPADEIILQLTLVDNKGQVLFHRTFSPAGFLPE